MDLQTKIEIIKCYYQSSNSPTAAVRLYKKRHGIHNDPFDSSAVQRIVKKFEEIGCVAHQAQGAGRPSLSDVRKESVLEALQDASNSNELRLSSVSAVSQLSDIPRSSVYRILRYDLNKHPYRLQMKQELSPDDFVKRETFAKWFLDIMLDSLDNVLWSDECYLDLQGGVDTHNAIIWADEKPKHVLMKPLHPEKVCVWIGFTAKFMLEPVILDEGTINGEIYLSMLKENVIPNLKRLKKCSLTVFLQDGAPPHIYSSVKQLLLKTFTEQRVISRNFSNSWPPRSPDLNPCDYYFWSHLKQKVYSGYLPKTKSELKARIFLTVDAWKEQSIT